MVVGYWLYFCCSYNKTITIQKVYTVTLLSNSRGGTVINIHQLMLICVHFLLRSWPCRVLLDSLSFSKISFFVLHEIGATPSHLY